MSHLLLTRDRSFGRLRNILRWTSESLTFQLVDDNSHVCLFCVYPAFCLGPLLYAFPDSVQLLTVVCWTREDCQQAEQFVQQQYPNRFHCQYVHCNCEETSLASVLTEKYDIILCWGWLERLFSSLELVKDFLTQVSLKLQPKGFFAGITINSSYIWTMAQKYLERHAAASYPMIIENPLWTLILLQGDVFSSIGTPLSIRYHSEMRTSRLPETEYLVHAPTLFHYCDAFGLEWIDWLSGRDWWILVI
ncbi:mRNA cap guanine-N7 methyltransferase 2 [Galdieria sulphuraria]|nr:mRNA cap guanine-N7 methyltransferase 2 [Galdieria sulphuraria]